MKRIIGGIAFIIGVYGVCECMYTTSNTDLQIQTVQSKFKPTVLSFSFDREDFISKLNPEVSKQMIELLNSSLEGDDASLECCSERIYTGLLSNKPIFKSDKGVDIDKRNEFIYGISMQILKNSIDGLLPAEASIIALKNVLTYCKPEAKKIGLFDIRSLISSIFFQIQYMSSLHGQL